MDFFAVFSVLAMAVMYAKVPMTCRAPLFAVWRAGFSALRQLKIRADIISIAII